VKTNTLAATLLQDHNNKKAAIKEEAAALKSSVAKPVIKRLKKHQVDDLVKKAVLMLKHDNFNNVCKKLSQDRQSFTQAFFRRGLRVSEITRGYKLEENALKVAA